MPDFFLKPPKTSAQNGLKHQATAGSRHVAGFTFKETVPQTCALSMERLIEVGNKNCEPRKSLCWSVNGQVNAGD